MIRYYNNRELSKNLGCNLARWKRWSREFLPPDPLGGLQSGYARQYSTREAFIVALGGHLVGFLKFSVHQAKTILADLDTWLENTGYYQWNLKLIREGSREEKRRQCYSIYIRVADKNNSNLDGFHYAVQVFPATDRTDETTEEPFDSGEPAVFIRTPVEIRKNFSFSPFIILLQIGQFRRHFIDRIHPPEQ